MKDAQKYSNIVLDVMNSIIEEGYIKSEMEVPIYALFETFVDSSNNINDTCSVGAVSSLIFACESVNCSNSQINTIIKVVKSNILAASHHKYYSQRSTIRLQVNSPRFNQFILDNTKEDSNNGRENNSCS